MYDELVKRLRELASIPAHCENVESCDGCSKEEICLSFTNKRIIEVATQAADAIQELQKRVPPVPHGRLIDADKLKTAFPCGESVRTECVRATIDYAPTIIPAEEG